MSEARHTVRLHVNGGVHEIDVFEPTGANGAATRRATATVSSVAVADGRLTIDATGCLWVALWGGAGVLELSPEGDELGMLEMPVRQPSSCAFGGQGLERLFVTSARDGLEVADDAPDGSLFVVDSPGVIGQPATVFAG